MTIPRINLIGILGDGGGGDIIVCEGLMLFNAVFFESDRQLEKRA